MAEDRWKEYKKEMAQVEVPQSLKDETIAKMKKQQPAREAGAKQARQPAQKWKVTPYAAAIVLLLVSGGSYLQSRQDSGNEIILAQSLEEDSVAEEVALSEGSLSFTQIPGEFQSMGMNLGVLGEERISVEEEAYFEYLGSNPLPEYLPRGMVKQEGVAQELAKDAEGNYTSDHFTVRYTDVGDSSLEIVLSKQGIPNEEECQEWNSSSIAEDTVRLAYYETQETTVFLAYFEANGIGYKLKGIGITQEEFIRIILSIVQKG